MKNNTERVSLYTSIVGTPLQAFENDGEPFSPTYSPHYPGPNRLKAIFNEKSIKKVPAKRKASTTVEVSQKKAKSDKISFKQQMDILQKQDSFQK